MSFGKNRSGVLYLKSDMPPEQQVKLKDAIDQFQHKCLMSFGKNRSGVPYLKSDMPRVLLAGEPDSTSAQEKQEALNAFRETIETVMVKHHTAFLNMFKQMMVGVFGPGIERMLSRVSPQASSVKVGETSAAQPVRDASAQPPSQSMGGQPINHLHKVWEVNRSSRLYKAMEVAQSNNRTCIRQWPIDLHMKILRSVPLEFYLTPLIG
jgi:hypothetical protein